MSSESELSLDNIDNLLLKFGDEIDELREALDGETDGAITTELEGALKQSEDLLEELGCVRDVFVEAERDRRPLSEDEAAAFKYFGFAVPADGRVGAGAIAKPNAPAHEESTAAPPVASPAPTAPVAPAAQTPAPTPAIELPADHGRTSTASSVRGGGPEDTETDPEHAPAHHHHHQPAYRASTPDDFDATYVVGGGAAEPSSVAAVPIVPSGTYVTPGGGRPSTGGGGGGPPSRGSSPAPHMPVSPPLNPASRPPLSPGLSGYPQQQPASTTSVGGMMLTEEEIEDRVRVRANELVDAARRDLEDEYRHRPPAVDQNAVDDAVNEERRRSDDALRSAHATFDAEIAALQAAHAAALEEASRSGNRAERDAEDAQRQAESATQAAEEMSHTLVDTQAALRTEQRKAADLEAELRRCQEALDELRATNAEASAADARAEWISFMRTEVQAELRSRYEPEIERLREENASLRQLVDGEAAAAKSAVSAMEAEALEKDAAGSAAAAPSGSPIEAAHRARTALAEVASATAAPQYESTAAPAGGDSDSLDAAVVSELNALGLPLPLGVRRVGAAGDFFIDCRVQMKLANGHVMVKRAGAQSTTYEPLSRYLTRVYGPLVGGVAPGGEHAEGPVTHREPAASWSPPSRQPASDSRGPSAARGGPSAHHYEPAPQHRPSQPPPSTSPARGVAAEPAPSAAAATDPVSRIRDLQAEQRALQDQLSQQRSLLQAHQQLRMSASPQRHHQISPQRPSPNDPFDVSAMTAAPSAADRSAQPHASHRDDREADDSFHRAELEAERRAESHHDSRSSSRAAMQPHANDSYVTGGPRTPGRATTYMRPVTPTQTDRSRPSLNEQLQRSQRQRLQEVLNASSGSSGYSTRAKGTSVPATTSSRTPPARGAQQQQQQSVNRSSHNAASASLANMSEEEVELLKRLALAKQVRDSRRQQQVATNRR